MMIMICRVSKTLIHKCNYQKHTNTLDQVYSIVVVPL